MNIQDKLERILRELHIMLSRAPVSDVENAYVWIHKKEMQQLLSALSQTVTEMMEQYEITEQSRLHGELEAEKHRSEIIRNANHQAQDIYAASVLYTEDALSRIQDIIHASERSAKEILARLKHDMEEEKRRIRSNQLELITQLEDMNDTAKYLKLIEDRNREIAKEKEQKKEKEQARKYGRKKEEEPPITPAVVPEIKINEEYFEKAGLTPEGLPKIEWEEEAVTEEPQEDLPKIEYEKPVIKVNPEYFEKIKKKEQPPEQKGRFSFGWKSQGNSRQK